MDERVKEEKNLSSEANRVMAAWAAGDGTQANPFIISNVEEFKRITENLSGFYRLASDIDFNGVTIIPIGTSSTPFTGGLDGDGHTVRNFKTYTSTNCRGLFAKAKGAKLKNLSIENAEIEPDSMVYYAGTLAGYLEGCATENISLSDVRVSGSDHAGALAGMVYQGSLMGCSVLGKSTVNSTGNAGTGGLVGEALYGAVLRCSAEAEVTGGDYTGGLVGKVSGGQARISECYAQGKVTGKKYVGGLTGYAGVGVTSSFAMGQVTSTTKDVNTGGLVGYLGASSIGNCFAACKVSPNASGLVYVAPRTTVVNSYFDSTITGLTAPSTQARTSEQMRNRETYVGWDWKNIWNDVNNSCPGLKNIIEDIYRIPFELTFQNLSQNSITLEWSPFPSATGYDILYQDKLESRITSQILIENLLPDTDYEFQVRAKCGAIKSVWSKPLKIHTTEIATVNGVHSNRKDGDSIALAWNPVNGARGYEVIYNSHIQMTDTNTCVLTGLDTNTAYTIQIRVLLEDGRRITSQPIVEKLYKLAPQTDYAKEFLEKCEGQTWFIDEIENLLNLQGKSVNTIRSKDDLHIIYAIGLANRGVHGSIPSAIFELDFLHYLYLANNDLSGKVPDGLFLPGRFIEIDLSGNHFSDSANI